MDNDCILYSVTVTSLGLRVYVAVIVCAVECIISRPISAGLHTHWTVGVLRSNKTAETEFSTRPSQWRFSGEGDELIVLNFQKYVK